MSTLVDTAFIGTFFDIPSNDIDTLITNPTTNAVTTFLRLATTKAKEFERLQASKLQLDVELETATRTANTKLKAQKSTAQRQTQEIEELRNKLNSSESDREQLRSQLSSLQHNASDTTTETQNLRSRIETLETSRRANLVVIDKVNREKDSVYEQLKESQTEVINLRADVRKLEQQNNSYENESSSQKHKDQILRQELQLLKKHDEWQAEQLSLKSSEFTKFRKERNAALNTVQRELEDASANVVALRQTEDSLRKRLDELQTTSDRAFTDKALLQEAAARAEHNFKAEIETHKRLVEAQTRFVATTKSRLVELEHDLDKTRDDAATEITKLQTEIETERADKVQAEAAIVELEKRLEDHERRVTPSVPGTPNGNTSALMIPGSSQKLGRGLTNTQWYSQFIEAKQELENEERRSASLQAALDELILEMETRAPELIEMRQEQERLESEILEFSRMLDDANATRDAAIQEAQRWQTENAASVREGDILRQQLRDLSAQVKILLVELQSRDRGLQEMSVQERLELERAARGEINYDNTTSRLISERLVLFRDVSDLQERNQQLLRLTRELGDKMEGEEALTKERESAETALENTQLRAQVERYQDEIQATTVQIDSYMKERDMFRRMLQHRGTLPADADTQAMFGNSLVPATPQRNGVEAATPRSRDVEDLTKLLKEQQKSFDEYRTESSQDRRILKDQADGLMQEKLALQLNVAHAQASNQLMQDRYKSLQGQLKILDGQNAQLRDQSQKLSETAARQDLRTIQAAEDSIEAQSTIASLRAENANVKAEKDLWKRTEARLIEDNKNLMDERSRISKLNSDLSTLANQREITEAEARQRFQTRVDSLEAQLSEAKQKLEAELENGKNHTLRREYEESQSRTRVDDLMKSLSNVREELVAAKTTKEQLQSRVDELKIELKAAEEKALALQPRTIINGTAEGDLSDEQRLAVQLADAKRELGLANADLLNVRSQVEEYKRIAQTAEDELASLGETAEQYREENDVVLAQRNAQIQELEKRVEDISTELQTTNQELSDLRTQHDDASRDLRSSNQSLEAKVKQLEDNVAVHVEEKLQLQDDVKAQADIATQAQQNYDSELVKHADATRALQLARQELQDMRTNIAQIKADAETAKATLDSSQDSWSEQKDRLEREISELKQRRTDIDAQNKLLHTELEKFSAQVQGLRQIPSIRDDNAEDSVSAASAANLQAIIKSLRSDKDIIEVQHELAVQQTRRLTDQLAYATRQVDELQSKLTEERKQSTDRALTDASTKKLADAINELNVYRESSTTLRNEARQARERYDEKSEELDRIRAELEPLKTKVAELEADVEVKDSEIALITQDRDAWRERSDRVLSKYDRVDPAEIEGLRARITELEGEKQTLEAAQEPLQTQIAEAEARFAEKEAAYTKAREAMVAQSKERSRSQSNKIVELRNELAAAQAEQTRLTSELETVKASMTADASNTANAAETSNQETVALRSKLAEADAQASVRTIEVEALQTQITEHKQQVAMLTSDLAKAQADLTALTAEQTSHDAETVEQSSSDEGETALQQAQKDLAEAQQQAQKDLAEAQQQINALRAERGVEEGETTDVEAAIAQVRSELIEQHQLDIKKAEEAADAKIAKMKSNLQRQLAESKTQIQEEARADLITKHNAEMVTLQAEHEQLITALKRDHQTQLEAVQQATETSGSRQSSSTSSLSEMDFSDEQVNDLMKTNPRLRTIVGNSIRKNVAKETESLKQSLAAKEAELVAKSNEPPAPATVQQDGSELATLRESLEKAKTEKEEAVRTAIDGQEKKFKLQLSSRDIAMAKVNYVQKAAQDTPQRAVVDVWEEAKKARPLAKAPSTPTTAIPPSAPAVTGNEDAKLQARKERFGNADTSAPNPEAASFVPTTSGIPTAAGRGGRGGGTSQGRGSFAIQGAAARGNSGIARGGRGGNNGGLKRQHEGGPGGDGKRARGGGNA